MKKILLQSLGLLSYISATYRENSPNTIGKGIKNSEDLKFFSVELELRDKKVKDSVLVPKNPVNMLEKLSRFFSGYGKGETVLLNNYNDLEYAGPIYIGSQKQK